LALTFYNVNVPHKNPGNRLRKNFSIGDFDSVAVSLSNAEKQN
jgi:hypothetical protein